MYQDKHEYNVIKGVIPDFGYDVKFAIKVDGEKRSEIPESQATDEEGNFYKVEVNCDNNVDGEWDYNAWNVKLNGVVENSKCTLSFVSNMDATERDNILKEGVAYRRNTYRGKDITSYWNGTETVNGRNLYEQISNCTFDDIYVGDYITGSQGVTWLIADINNYLYAGNQNPGLEKCHATIIPAGILGQAGMNSTDTAGISEKVTEKMSGYEKGGYLGSEMKNITLPKILSEKVEPDFKDHILTYSTLLSSAIDPKSSNQLGQSDRNIGASSNWEWVDSQIDLMSEVNVYGSTVVGSSFFDIGLDNRQYAIFKLKPEFINTDGNGHRYWYWLKAVASSESFVNVSNTAIASNNRASSANCCIRPRFLID